MVFVFANVAIICGVDQIKRCQKSHTDNQSVVGKWYFMTVFQCMRFKLFGIQKFFVPLHSENRRPQYIIAVNNLGLQFGKRVLFKDVNLKFTP